MQLQEGLIYRQDFPRDILTEKLVKWGITSVSVSPDSIDKTRNLVYRIEQTL